MTINNEVYSPKNHLLYRLLKIPAKIAIHFYCRSIRINNKELLAAEGPLLIACNHPSSFLDAVIIATLFKRPVYSLTRGDVYSTPFRSKILHALKMFPVFRISEGVENMNQNYETFEKCKEVFKNNGIVLIFSEGLCINEWHLRPLKKGTARLAVSSWNENIPLKILPAALNYSAFKLFGKNVIINFGETLHEEDIDHTNGYGKTILDFNKKLTEKLKPLTIELAKEDAEGRRKIFCWPQPTIKKMLLSIPAVLGYIFHAPVYLPVRSFTKRRFERSGHFDSVIVALLFVLYPLYLLVLLSIAICIFGQPGWLLLILIPFCAWSYVQLKKQI